MKRSALGLAPLPRPMVWSTLGFLVLFGVYACEDGATAPRKPKRLLYPAMFAPTWSTDRIDQRAVPLTGTYTPTFTGVGVRVYVIDSGIDTTHPDFGGRASWGADFSGAVPPNTDCMGHGTHVSGTVGGTTMGVAPGVLLVAVRVFGCSGGAETEKTVAAVNWVTANAVHPAVVLLALSGIAEPDDSVSAAVATAIASGLTFAVAAGNNAGDACGYTPGQVATALTTAGSTPSDLEYFPSNVGSCVDLYAPGYNIQGPWPGGGLGINWLNGTSSAAAHVAGAAAQLLQSNPTLTPGQIAVALLAQATPGKITSQKTPLTANLLLYVTGGTEPKCKGKGCN